MKKLLLALCLLAMLNPGRGQSRDSTRISNIENRIDSLMIRVDSELKTANLRYESMVQLTDRAFSVLYLMVAIGSLSIAIFVFLSRARDKERYADYQKERSFYLGMARESSEREARFTEQRLSLGANVLAQSDEMLSKQIENIAKLGQVIGLIKETFALRLKEEEEYKNRLDQLSETVSDLQSKVTVVRENFEEQYERVKVIIINFRNLSRMDWPRLSSEQEQLAARARALFGVIPEFIIHEQEAKDRYDLALVITLLGVSAYYANDIEASEAYLKRGLALYAVDPEPRRDDLYPRAICNHFLGLIAKNSRKNPTDPHLEEAKRHLMEADRLLIRLRPEDEFLTPLTLAEVLTYIPTEREEARTLLEGIIKRLEKLKTSGKLNRNQSTLLARALLLHGNIDIINGRPDEALLWYEKAVNHNKEHPFALLSKAQVMPANDAHRKEHWKKGLETLERSGSLEKRERAVLVWILAWAALAAGQLRSPKERHYKTELERLEIPVVAGREPLFFDPITKGLSTFDRLIQNLNETSRANL